MGYVMSLVQFSYEIYVSHSLRIKITTAVMTGSSCVNTLQLMLTKSPKNPPAISTLFEQLDRILHNKGPKRLTEDKNISLRDILLIHNNNGITTNI